MRAYALETCSFEAALPSNTCSIPIWRITGLLSGTRRYRGLRQITSPVTCDLPCNTVFAFCVPRPVWSISFQVNLEISRHVETRNVPSFSPKQRLQGRRTKSSEMQRFALQLGLKLPKLWKNCVLQIQTALFHWTTCDRRPDSWGRS